MENSHLSSSKIALSVVIIAKNAASQIGACIDSTAFADEVLVVDSGSEDGTRAIAEMRGCRVIEKEWLGFGRQKQFAVSAAKHDWVLCLDIDEIVTPTLAASIATTLAAPQHQAYRMPRRNRFLGCWLTRGEGYPDWSLRMFHRSAASWSNDEVHESVITTASVGTLVGDLLHVPRMSPPISPNRTAIRACMHRPCIVRACVPATPSCSSARWRASSSFM